eukprot:17062_1
MGQALSEQCIQLSQCTGGESEKKKKKIEELERTLKQQSVAKSDMKKKLQQQMKQMKEYKRKHHKKGARGDAVQKKIIQLKHEKKQVFNNLLDERRHAITLEDQIEECKTQIMDLDDKLKTLKQKNPNKRFPILIIPEPRHSRYQSSEEESEFSENETDSSEGDIISSHATSTIGLDDKFDVGTDVALLDVWLDKKINWNKRQSVVTLKKNLAGLLSKRSEGYRVSLVCVYYETYRRRLEADILAALQKGKAVDTIHGLLMTRAEYDATLIHDYVQDWAILPIAEIICCRSMSELVELNEAYKRKCKGNMKKQLQSLAKREKKKTLVKVIANILDFGRKEEVDVDLSSVNKDLEFVLSSSNFKGKNKERLILIFTTNSVQYIKVFRGQFAIKNQKDSLSVFIDKKLGPKSTAGYFCKTRIHYALDTPKYFAEKIEHLGHSFKKNHKKISNILIQRMEIDLDSIQIAWQMNKYGDGKDMQSWIMHKTSKSMAGYFLVQMLQNCRRYAQFRKTEKDGNKKKSKVEQMIMGGY